MKRTPEEILEKMDALLDEYEGAVDKFDRGQFKDKFGERLGQYSEKLKLLNGDDFDVVSKAYDEHKADYSDMSDDDYVNALEENIKKAIERIWPEAPEEAVTEIAEEAAEAAESEPEVEVTEEPAESEEETTSDEKTKEKDEEAVKEVAKANPVAEIVTEAVTAKPEDVKETELEEAYTFNPKDPIYRMSH